MNNKKARVIAFYLPQFHPIPENDKWWGKGFTEWTNVGKAKPLFRGHHQPRIPADLGYYDLRMPEVREAQAEMAREAGIEGFCYWHYWFGNGKELLERPFNEVVDSGNPDFPFCLGWANHHWETKTWTASNKTHKGTMIAEMLYHGKEDHILHFNTYLKAFKDPRYIKVDGKLLFVVWDPNHMPDAKEWMNCWNELAQINGLNGFHFVGISQNFRVTDTQSKKLRLSLMKSFNNSAKILFEEVLNNGFNAINSQGSNRANVLSNNFYWYYFCRFLMRCGIKITLLTNYKKVINNCFVEEDKWENVYPTIIPNYDRSPRSGKDTNLIWFNSTPELFGKMVENALSIVEEKQPEHKILFLQSWNEWGEGNYMEPDLKFGNGFLDILKSKIISNN